MLCSCDDCERPAFARGWCRMHYARWFRTGSPEGAPKLTIDERFMQYVEKEPGGCWRWTASQNGKGYGWFAIKKSARWGGVAAHRWSYERFVGPIPTGLDLDHLCRNPICCNPDHLEPVTRKENLRRGTRPSSRQPKTVCARGHLFDEGNTYVYPNGRRACRICMNAGTRRSKAKKRASSKS